MQFVKLNHLENGKKTYTFREFSKRTHIKTSSTYIYPRRNILISFYMFPAIFRHVSSMNIDDGVISKHSFQG